MIFISDRFDNPSDGDHSAEDKNTGDKSAYWGAYAASKTGLEGLARVLADEMDAIGNPKIFRIYPGSMRTSLRRRAFPAENPAEIPIPEEAADRAVFALGPGCPLANGQIGIVER